MSERRDRELGMLAAIPRRDFLNGIALTAGGLLLPRWFDAAGVAAFAPERAADYYPPALTGLRGSHDGSWETAHAMRDGDFWREAGSPIATGESYELVVVGAGISGLSAAHFFRKHLGPGARVLLLDNHDDFGGHAKRNELRRGERVFLAYGGTFSIDSPAPYSAVAKGLVAELGVDVARFQSHVDWELYASRGLERAVFFDKETFGVDRLLPDPGGRRRSMSAARGAQGDPWRRFLAEAPLPEKARRDLLRLYTEPRDYMPGLSSDRKKARLARISYAAYLTDVAGADPGVLPFLQARPHGLYGVGIDAVSAQDAWGLGLPGLQGLGLDAAPGPGMGRDAIRNEEAERYFFHFPDGNASLARLLVRRLVPGAIPGSSVEDVVTARADYARLDEEGAPVRIRLNSTAVRVSHLGDPATAREVEVAYVRGGRLQTVRARACILACWNSVIPYLCPELPEPQRQALADSNKVPIVYTNVLLRNWRSFVKLKLAGAHCPGGYHTELNLDMPVSIGGYRFTGSPEEPIVIHLSRTPCSPGLSARDQHRAGRAELLATPFPAIERKIRDQLARILGPGGFDPAADVLAITVNRWPHGYAYQYNSLFDAYWLEGGEQPCVAARRPFGRLAIANADADAYAYTDAAIDQAHRAVDEILSLESRPPASS
jgi:spermidine dehydrogenase